MKDPPRARGRVRREGESGKIQIVIICLFLSSARTRHESTLMRDFRAYVEKKIHYIQRRPKVNGRFLREGKMVRMSPQSLVRCQSNLCKLS